VEKGSTMFYIRCH